MSNRTFLSPTSLTTTPHRHNTTHTTQLAAHSADGGGNTDPRLVRIPGNTYPANAKRPIFASPESYPRYVGVDPRSKAGSIPEYLSENCQAGGDTSASPYCADWVPIGYVPQVESTYSYYEAVYGVMNVHQVGISESTCSAVYAAKGVSNGGLALLSINALSQIAMERASTAREAVQIMGDLSEKYGFYGASASFEGGGESLIVTDANEGWVFHILADPTGTYISCVCHVLQERCAVLHVALFHHLLTLYQFTFHFTVCHANIPMPTP
jgi:dipeptidase